MEVLFLICNWYPIGTNHNPVCAVDVTGDPDIGESFVAEDGGVYECFDVLVSF